MTPYLTRSTQHSHCGEVYLWASGPPLKHLWWFVSLISSEAYLVDSLSVIGLSYYRFQCKGTGNASFSRINFGWGRENELNKDVSWIVSMSFRLSGWIIIWCILQFLFIGRELTTWPWNNCLLLKRNTVQMCFAARYLCPAERETKTSAFTSTDSLRTPSKPPRQRQRERHQTKGLMSRTMAVHVRCKPLTISLSSSANEQREMTKFCVF